MSTQTIHLYFGARQTCLEMMTDRHYQIPQQLFLLTEDKFDLNQEGHMVMSNIRDTQNLPVYVILSQDDKEAIFNRISVNTSQSVATVADLKEVKDAHLIIICQMTHKMSQLSTEFIGHPTVEIFDVRHMFINPTKHIYQPKWRLMKDDEITEMLQRYETKTPQVSRVLLGSVCIDDPVNRYYGGRPPSKDRKGDVYEIIREGVTVFYRKVVAKRINVKPDKKK